MEIPLVDLRAGYETIKDEVRAKIDEVFGKMALFLGENVESLEKEFAHYCGLRYGVGVGSGTEAIHLALLACGVKKGDEVITVSNTFFASCEAIVHTGAKPVFVDIDPETFNIDVAKVEAKINKNTRAILPVHLYGQPADMGPLLELAKKYDLFVVEDACQAHGATYVTSKSKIQNPKKVGSFGDIGCFSFYMTKNLGGYGEGGMVLTDNADLAKTVRLLRNHGRPSKFEHTLIGYNSRLDEIQAAILRVKLKRLDENNKRRKDIAMTYNELLKDTSISTPYQMEGITHVYHLYVVKVDRRDELREYLAAKGIGTGIHYKVPIHLQKGLQGYGYKRGDLPQTEDVCKKVLSLPMYPELSKSKIEYITQALRSFYKE